MDGETKIHTYLGQLEYKAKSNKDEDAIQKLAEHAAETIQSLPFYKDADLLIPVPPSKMGVNQTPLKVAGIVGEKIQKTVKPILSFKNPGSPMKNSPIEDKLQKLEQRELVISPDERDSLRGKSVILLDDKYQSGVTANYVAWKLQEAGVKYVYGLFLVKTLRDSDNQ